MNIFKRKILGVNYIVKNKQKQTKQDNNLSSHCVYTEIYEWTVMFIQCVQPSKRFVQNFVPD